MDRRRTESPVYARQWSGGSSSTGSSSPARSPAHPHSRLPPAAGMSTIKRTQNFAAKAAAQRLAQVMASQTTDDDEEDDDLGFRFGAPPNSNSNNGLPAISFAKPNRSPSPALGRNFMDHTPPVRSTSAGRSSMSVRSAQIVPPSTTSRSSLRTQDPIPQIELPRNSRLREKRFTSDAGRIESKDTGNQHEASALRDELRHAEEKREAAEARARELEKQAALKAAKQSKDGRDEEVAALRTEIESIKDETAGAVEQLQEAESEAKTLRTMTQRMILTHEEMDKRLRRNLGMLASGDDSNRSKLVRDLNDLTGEGNIETMLSVEMSLRELASLKVEDAIVLTMAQHRRPNLVRQSSSDFGFLVAELSEEETEDVLFKEAWLTYFWRRAKVHGVEEDIAEERLEYWISRSGQPPTPHDAVDVERGLTELRKLGIEQQLWEASRKEIDQTALSSVASSNPKSAVESEMSL
ncbi:hypothetical protein LguiB_008083 [Lonicera macranthoides]